MPAAFCCAVALQRLLPLNADHRGTGTDHIEFVCRSTAQVDDATTAIWPAIHYPHNDRLAIMSIGHPHHRSKRQGAMGGGKPVGAGAFAACGATTAIKRRTPRFGVNSADC